MNAFTPEQEKINELNRKAWEIRFSDTMRCGHLSEEAIELAKSINYRKGLAEGLRTYAFALDKHSRHEHAAELLNEAMQIFRETGDVSGQSDIHEFYGIMARKKGDFRSALVHLYSAQQLRKNIHQSANDTSDFYELGVTYQHLGLPEKAIGVYLLCAESPQRSRPGTWESNSINNMGGIYLELQRPGEALACFQKCLPTIESQGNQRGIARCFDNIGRSYFMLGEFDKAYEYYFKGNKISSSISDKQGEGNTLFHLAELELTLSNPGLAMEYATLCNSIRTVTGDKKGQVEVLLLLIDLNPDNNKLPLMKMALDLVTASGSPDLSARVHYKLYEYHKKNHAFNNALEHLELYHHAEKDFHSAALTQKLANMQLVHQVEQELKESEIHRLRNIELTGLKAENDRQNNEISLAMEKLNLAQIQFVQQEKMAILGNLTAGIAHEIQNPLNFVNNFAEPGPEIIDKLSTEMRKGNLAESLLIAADLKNMFNNIVFHGQRANALVRMMSQHAIPGTGKKQMTGINNLVDEYLRLAYQSMRSKDKTFNAMLQTDFDKNAGRINIISQDIGLALLTLFNHAFYAVTEKLKQSGIHYEPTITVTTKRENGRILIQVTNNDASTPEKISGKIFQPNMTSKPNEEIGSGMLMCYDIIHSMGGNLRLDIRENEFSGFIIELPV
jgi:signal transduction histidine kinase/NTP pyrophosphatase (non-canonical NTP hydrolase)